MTTEKMISRVEDGIGYITFNNPEKHNAVSIEMWDALENILDDFRENQNIRNHLGLHRKFRKREIVFWIS